MVSLPDYSYIVLRYSRGCYQIMVVTTSWFNRLFTIYERCISVSLLRQYCHILLFILRPNVKLSKLPIAVAGASNTLVKIVSLSQEALQHHPCPEAAGPKAI